LEESTTRILVVDDYEPWRRYFRTALHKQPELQVIGEASDGLEAVQKAQELQPDLILLDIGLPLLNGLEVARRIRKVSPASRILFVSENRSADIVEEALRTGAVGYVVKSAVDTELLAAIRAVAQGRTFIDASLGLGFAQTQARPASASAPGETGTAQLTGRELEVMRRVAEGFTNTQIAEELRLGVKSVETYRSRVMEKLGLESRSALVRFALDCGVLGGGPR